MRRDLSLDAVACPGTSRIGPGGDCRPRHLPSAGRCSDGAARYRHRSGGCVLPGARRAGPEHAVTSGRRGARRVGGGGRELVRYRDDHRRHLDARRPVAHHRLPGADGAEATDGGELGPLRGRAQPRPPSAPNVGIRYISGGARAVLLIGAESDNQLVDLPGQGGRVHIRGAAAVVLTQAGNDGGVLSTTAGGAARTDANGDAHDRTLLRGLTEAAAECLQKADMAMSEIDLVIGEQSAPEIMQAWSKQAGVSAQRMLLDPVRYGSLRAG